MNNDITFGEFMTEVVNRADKISFEKSGRPLSDKYEAPSTILKMIGAISNKGWNNFTELAHTVLKDSYFEFAGALAPFLFGGIGGIIASSLAYWGGQSSIKLFYNNKKIVEDVKAIGDRYENRFNECTTDDGQDKLINEAAEELYNLK